MEANTDSKIAKSILFVLTGICCGLLCGGACLVFAWISSLCDKTFQENTWLLMLLPLAGVAVVLLYDYFRSSDELGMDILFRYSHKESRDRYETTDYVSPWLAPLIATSTCLAYLTGGSLGRVGSALQVGGGIGALLHKFYCKTGQVDRHRSLFLACGISAGFTAMLNTPIAGAIFGVEVLILTGSDLLIIIPTFISSFITWFMAGVFKISYVDLHVSPETAFNIALTDTPAGVLFWKVLIIAFATTLLGRIYAYSRTGVEKAFSLISHRILRVIVGTLLVVAITLIIGKTCYNGIGFIYVRQILDGNGSQYAFILKLLLTTITLGCGIRGGDISPSIFIGATGCFTLGTFLGADPATAAAIGIVGTLGTVTKCPIAVFFLGLEMLCFSKGAIICFAITSLFVHIFSGTYGIYHQQHSEDQILKLNIK